MKKLILFGALALGLTISIRAQQVESFHTDYKEMAIRDALHEQTLVTLSKADEDDYVQDQKKFEADLRNFNQSHYSTYMRAKQDAYRRLNKRSRNSFEHSNLYSRLAKHYSSFPTYETLHPKCTLVAGEEIYR